MEVVREKQELEKTPEDLKAEHNKIVDDVISKVENNNFKIYFYCPAMSSPSGGISVIFKMAKILKDGGYNIAIVYEPRQDSKASYQESQKKGKKIEIFEKFNPTWLGDKLLDGIDIKCLGDGKIKFSDNTTEECEKLTINAEDIMIIPEGFPNIMQRFADIPCKKIVLAQSWYYILNSLQVGQKWQHFGITDTISLSDGITEYLNAIMPGLRIKNFSQSIDRNIFKPRKFSEKYPKIAYMPGRSQEAVLKTHNVIKTFKCFFPQYAWIRFDELRGLPKEEFAERLAESAFALYTDEIAGFGTLPLESMATNTHVLGWTNIGGREFMSKNNGYWASSGDIFQLAELMGIAIEKYLMGELDASDVTAEYEKTLERYTEQKEKEKILEIFNTYKNERIAEFQSIKQQ